MTRWTRLPGSSKYWTKIYILTDVFRAFRAVLSAVINVSLLISPQAASRDQVVGMLEKARAVMPAKLAAPAKAGGGKGSAEPSRAASG